MLFINSSIIIFSKLGTKSDNELKLYVNFVRILLYFSVAIFNGSVD